MKKTFFSIIAIALLSATAFAGGGRSVAKKHKAIKTCTTQCPPNCTPKDCQKYCSCPHCGAGCCN